MERSDNKLLRIALSVLLALVLWAYVGKTQNVEETQTFRNLPVSFVGMEILEERGMMISSGRDQNVTIQVRASRDVLEKLGNAAMTVTVDVSSAVNQVGIYSLPYQVNTNLSGTAALSSYNIISRSPQNVSFTVSKMGKRTIPVQGSFAGSVAENYQAGAFTFSPESIEIWGEESLVNQIYYAQVVLDQQDISGTYSGDLPYSLISFSGEVIDPAGLEANTALVRTTLPVVQLKQVPLTVKLLPGGGATDANASVKIEPASIMVSGSSEALEPLKEIALNDIDLSKVISGDVITRPIELATELTNESGISEARVTVTIRGLSTATLEVDNIELINPPEGYVPEKITQSRQVTIRGPEEAVASVSASQLRIVADLSQLSAATGIQTVPVKVYLDGRNDVGVVGEYNISVSISK